MEDFEIFLEILLDVNSVYMHFDATPPDIKFGVGKWIELDVEEFNKEGNKFHLWRRIS